MSAEDVCMNKLRELGTFHKYLSPEISQSYIAEAKLREVQLLQLLSSDPAPPNPSELSYALRCLRSFYDQQFDTTLEFKASVSTALWRLFATSPTASDQQTPLYSYSLRLKLVQNLSTWLKDTADEHMPEHWQQLVLDDASVTIFRNLQQLLDIRLPVRMIVDEMGASPRVDISVSGGKPRTLVSYLVHLCHVSARYLDPSTGVWLSQEVASKLDGNYSYTMLYARLLVLLTPMSTVPQLVQDGQLWTWWSSMPEGLVPKFDLMWFALLARYAEIQWTDKIGEALATSGSSSSASDCHTALVNQLPWLMNKICRTLALPFGSPAATAMDGKKQSPPDLDRYQIPEEIDGVVMGHLTTWKDVAKFLIYSLEPSPPEQISNTSAWSLLMLLHRRMRPFLIPAHANGEWIWHCSTLIYWLVFHYHKRICRERLVANKAPSSKHLTKAADEKFVEMMLPITQNLLTTPGQNPLQTVENVSRLSQIAAVYSPPSTGMELLEGPSDAFNVDMPGLMFKAAEVLNDPGQSDRHVGLLHMCSTALPALLLRMPAAIGGLLPISLLGIDATDAPKTLVSMQLLISTFSRVACCNANDWSVSGGDAENSKAALRWPVAKGCQLDTGMPDGGVVMISSMLPTFAVNFIDHMLEYVTKIPKPAKKGADLQSMTMGMMHGVVCLIASQCDKVTYEQMTKSVAQFVETTLLPDQVKPAGLLVSAIVRCDPDISLPILMPVLLKKLLKPIGAAKVPFHEAGVSDSEAKWNLSMLAATVRAGGSRLLTYKTDIESIVRSALLDERETVGKLGLKVLRRVLCSISSIYVDNDYRLCSAADWNTLMGSRLGSATSDVAAPLAWSGPVCPWWAKDKESPSATWHIPSEQEVAWARELSLGALIQVGKLLATIPVADLPSLDGKLSEMPTWLEGFSDCLPSKRKSSHAAVLAMRMAGTILRGTCELWPDERDDNELSERILPKNLAIAGDTGRIIYEWLGDALVATFKVLIAQEQENSAIASSLDAIEVSKVIKKMLKCIGEYLGGFRELHPTGLQLFPAMKNAHQLQHALTQLSGSLMEGLHSNSRWRDISRVWWVERLTDVQVGWLHERYGGHRFSGRRRALMEIMCRESIQSNFSEVRSRSMDILSKSMRYHVGCRWPLIRDVLLPAMAAETQAALQCSSLSGEAADREQQRLNDALSGLAVAFGGGIQGLAMGIWRRGVDDAANVGLALCETMYASTKTSRSMPVNGNQEQKCEVKSTTVAQIIGSVKHWLDCREGEGSGNFRSSSKVPELEDNDDLPEIDLSAAKGMAALEVVGKLLDLCERTDCHWRAQVIATTVSLALLNSFGPSGVPCGCSDSPLPKQVWTRWGQWLVKCCEPKGQPGLHTLAVHSLLLMLKSPAPLNDSSLKELGICEPAFMQKLLAVVPRLHHDKLMNTGDQGGQNLEPTQSCVTTITSAGSFKLWPRSWVKKASQAFSLRNALFWQSYCKFLSKNVTQESVVEVIRGGVEHLASQPTSEPEFHAALTELSAGCFRALRKGDEASSNLRVQIWTQLRPTLLAEVQQASQERLEDWCDATRFITTGCQRPLLKGTKTADAEDKFKFLYPLFNFVLGGDAELKFDSLSCAMPPIHFDYNSSETASDNGKGSSFDIYKRLRLLMSLLVEPSATKFIGTDQAFCKKLVELLQGGLGHPYKQLREEVARAIYFLLRSAGHGDSGLRAVAAELEDWLCAEAQRLLLLLQKDNAAHVKESDDAARPRHVIESSGLCYTLLHAALARMTSTYFSKAGPSCFTFLLAASAHGDFELRVLAAHALSLCCAAHPIGPDAEQKPCWQAMLMTNALTQAVCTSDALTHKELEKAYSSAFKPIIMANFFLLSAHDGTQGTLAKLREASEQALGHSKPEVRTAARGAVTSFLALEPEADITKLLSRFKKLAGPARKATSSEVIVLDSESSLSIGVGGLTCALLAAADVGVPRWTGKAVQAIVPYGRQGLPEGVRKEVQGAIQAFLKLQQSNQRNWKEFQEKMTPSQLELLDDGKGKLSYFS